MIMKKMIFVTINKMHEHDGVSKKILSQISALSGMGFTIDFVSTLDAAINIENCTENRSEKIYTSRFMKYFLYLFLVFFLLGKRRRYNVAYIRNPHGGFFSIFLPIFLFYLNKTGCKKIYLEIPTFPYENEITDWKGRLSYSAYKLSRFFFLKYVDEIVYMGDPVDNIWGKNCIRIANGVDVSSLPVQPVKPSMATEDEINFIAVARLESWHGYDRFIKGLASYYKSDCASVSINLHVVGDNQPCLSQLKSLTVELGLEKKVFFHGALSGKPLDHVFSKCHVAIDALGRHRTGNNFNSSIKSKEYTARGIPFIKSHVDDSFESCRFVFECPPDDSDVDISKVLVWFKEETLSPSDIRGYAVENLTWEQQFKFMTIS